jgi:fluoroquinolone transport system permease protein
MKSRLSVLTGSARLIRRDPMLLMMLCAPFLAGAAFYFGLPLLRPLLMSAFALDIAPWYALADAMLLMLAPLLAGTLCGFLMLDERDDGVGAYYTVTPLGRSGYLISRLVFPILWSIIIGPLLMVLFSLSHPDYMRVFAIALVGGLFGAFYTLMLLAFAGNKVEGLAVSKMMGLTMLPMLLPFFIRSPWTALAGVFPSYWMGALLHDSLWLFPLALVVCAIWLVIFYRRIRRHV